MPDAFNVPVPRTVLPFMKLTVPVAMVDVVLLTAALNVTIVPNELVAGVALTVVVEAALPTVMTAGEGETDSTYSGSPLYVAVMV